MTTSTFIFVEGMSGDSTAPKREGWIDAWTTSWGVGHEPGANAASFGQLQIVKSVDSASPELALACAESRVIPTVTVEVVEESGGELAKAPLSKLRFHNCRVEALTPAVSVGGTFQEQISISYSEVEWSYSRTMPDGKKSAPIARSFALQPSNAPQASSSAAGEAGIPARPRGNTLYSVEYVPNTAFIVMWMDPEHPELEDVHLTVKEVCRSFGISAMRADDIQHDERITDVILEKIRTSEFVFADLTGERPNVYYEVGHAHAIGKRPILFRRRGSAIHFDLSIHNVREYKNVTELRELLSKRLEALTK